MVTTIQLSEELKQKIGSLKRKESETYEQVIARLVAKQEYEFKVKEYYRKYGTELSAEDKAWESFDPPKIDDGYYGKRKTTRSKK